MQIYIDLRASDELQTFVGSHKNTFGQMVHATAVWIVADHGVQTLADSVGCRMSVSTAADVSLNMLHGVQTSK